MRSKLFNLDWTKFDIEDKVQRKQLSGALQVYMSMPNKFLPSRFSKVEAFVKKHKEFQEGLVQMFGIPSNFPVNEKAIDVVRKYHVMPEYDNGYEQIFDVLNFEGSKTSGFDVMDIAGGLVFREYR